MNSLKHKPTLQKGAPETTDAAPCIICREAGFVTLFTKQVGYPLLGFHCIVHEEALCEKAGLKGLEDVMKTVMKVVNYIVALSLKKRQFHSLLSEVNSIQRIAHV
jgi:hypothetical protein